MLSLKMKKKLKEILADDICGSDVTSALVPKRKCRAKIVSKESCIIAGLEEVKFLFKSNGVNAGSSFRDGERVRKHSVVLKLSGKNQTVFSGRPKTASSKPATFAATRWASGAWTGTKWQSWIARMRIFSSRGPNQSEATTARSHPVCRMSSVCNPGSRPGNSTLRNREPSDPASEREVLWPSCGWGVQRVLVPACDLASTRGLDQTASRRAIWKDRSRMIRHVSSA